MSIPKLRPSCRITSRLKRYWARALRVASSSGVMAKKKTTTKKNGKAKTKREREEAEGKLPLNAESRVVHAEKYYLLTSTIAPPRFRKAADVPEYLAGEFHDWLAVAVELRKAEDSDTARIRTQIADDGCSGGGSAIQPVGTDHFGGALSHTHYWTPNHWGPTRGTRTGQIETITALRGALNLADDRGEPN